MGQLFDYREVPCPACGHFNRRFGSALLDGRYAFMCDRCGRDLATGRFSMAGGLHWVMLRLAVWFACSLIGVFLMIIPFGLLPWMFLGHRHEALRISIWYVGMLAGIAGGIGVAERNFRRGGLTGPKRVADDSPGERAAFAAKTARQWCLGLGCLSGVVVGVAASWFNRVLGAPLPIDKDGLAGLGMIIGLIAGWALCRRKYPRPPREGSDA